ncbi:hypothetical protein C9I98_14715 [Photobacterium sanctipauli]|uniref:Uncharacterized protein n=1 Tax=Photobacterium sanctipauli TaxID=1342794 RepID=A0A2T3NR45_9GAMM|nr:hypothetical protein [Photobacterium sanctipauli]PSW18725.1 hypothetical protein C9I98_14715 [Photobacterium sanctipauli]
MINPNNNLPLSAQKQLKKVTQSSLISERKQKVEAKEEPESEEPKQQSKKRPPKGLLDIYV